MNKILEKMVAERINKNMTDFEASLMGLSKREIISMAHKIAAMKDTHFQLTTYQYFDEDDVELLLTFQNPLEIIAGYWEGTLNDESVDFDYVLFDFFDDFEENMAVYPLMYEVHTAEPNTAIDSENSESLEMLMINYIGATNKLLIALVDKLGL